MFKYSEWKMACLQVVFGATKATTFFSWDQKKNDCMHCCVYPKPSPRTNIESLVFLMPLTMPLIYKFSNECFKKRNLCKCRYKL